VDEPSGVVGKRSWLHAARVAHGGERGIVRRSSLQGQRLGRYLVLEPLGRGGMARVYRAYHPQLDRYVAIKVLHSDLVEDTGFLARFRHEAQAIAALRHPHIVQVYDFDVQDGMYYMVMELLEGDTLKMRLHDYRNRAAKVPLGEVTRITLDILDGLAYAHSAGVVHRDIKPANILLTREGEAVLADFGIAHILGSTRHTASGALMGTLSYIAPEQGLEGKSDERSDLYSLGIVFYEMLTGHTPFDADTPLAILMKHLNDPLPAPHELDPTIPKPFEEIVLRVLAKCPEDRYQSAEEMADALRGAVEETGLEVPSQVSLPAMTSNHASSSESVVVLSGVERAELARTNLVGDTTVRALQNPEPRQKVDEARDRTRRAILRGIGLVGLGNAAAVTVVALTDRWPVFATGWPVELLLVGVALSMIMSAASSIWLLAPVGMLLGNGMLLSYTALANRWIQWRYLWPLDLWLALSLIAVTIWLGRRDDRSRRLSRWLGRALGGIAAAWMLLIAFVATLV
jgi:serine/threonine protein kinase